MDIEYQIIPAAVLLAANLMSGRHASLRWEAVTAVFGWVAALSLVAFLVAMFIARESAVTGYLLQAWVFCLLTVLSRDYEKILRPIFLWNR